MDSATRKWLENVDPGLFPVESKAIRAALAALDKAEGERDALRSTLRTTRSVLHTANNDGDIQDTLWAGDCLTLFDFIDAALASPTQPAPAGECRNPYCDEAALCCKAAKETP